MFYYYYLVFNDGSLVMDKYFTGKGDEVVKAVDLPSSCLGPIPKSPHFRPHLWVALFEFVFGSEGFSSGYSGFPLSTLCREYCIAVRRYKVSLRVF